MKKLLSIAACALLLALPGCGDCCKKCEPTEQTEQAEHVHTGDCCHDEAAAPQKENYTPAE